jgi:hypothetical protein
MQQTSGKNIVEMLNAEIQVINAVRMEMYEMLQTNPNLQGAYDKLVMDEQEAIENRRIVLEDLEEIESHRGEPQIHETI